LGIRGTGSSQELISFEDPSGTTKWHINQNFNGNSGLNFVETGLADGRLFIQAGGNVGVGTTTPRSSLHIDVPASPNPISALSVDVESFINFTNAQASHFFRVRDIGASSTPFYIRGDGNVGIGTTTPNETLDVRGNIKLHLDGSLYAPGGVENLRIIRGTVGANGNTIAGAGFSVKKESTGIYTLTFSPQFSAVPSGSVTQILPDHGGFLSDTSGKAEFLVIDDLKARVMTTGNVSGNLVVDDRDFTFVIMGLR
jgi:hypothetical protein